MVIAYVIVLCKLMQEVGVLIESYTHTNTHELLSCHFQNQFFCMMANMNKKDFLQILEFIK